MMNGHSQILLMDGISCGSFIRALWPFASKMRDHDFLSRLCAIFHILAEEAVFILHVCESECSVSLLGAVCQ